MIDVVCMSFWHTVTIDVELPIQTEALAKECLVGYYPICIAVADAAEGFADFASIAVVADSVSFGRQSHVVVHHAHSHHGTPYSRTVEKLPCWSLACATDSSFGYLTICSRFLENFHCSSDFANLVFVV